MSNRFKPYSNSPSTPNRKGRFFSSNPSTTPAGPPPSYITNASTTPAGPPPRSIFGSSVNPPNTFGRRGNTPGRRGFTVPESSPPLDEDEEDEDADADADAEGEEDDELQPAMKHHVAGVQTRESVTGNALGKSAFMSSIMSNSPRGLKRSRNGQVREQVGSDYAAIARGVTSHTQSPALSEPDEVLLREEEMLSRMEATKSMESAQEGAAQLTKLWSQHSNSATKEGRVGPEAEDALTRSTYLSTLLLQLHHPHRLKPGQVPHTQRMSALSKRTPINACTIPRALLDWLETYHNPFPDDFQPISQHQPSPSNHERFWDSIFASLCRGKFDQAIALLRYAGWENAVTAEEDSKGQQQGYSGRQLDNIEEVVESCIHLIESCPAVKYDDFDVKGSDWRVFRQRAQQALKNLEQFAGDEDEEEDDAQGGGNMFTMSSATRRAESRVPWTIYTNLKLCYDILLGSAEEIMDASQDWLEASIYIAAWWDGQDTSADAAGLGRSSMRRSLAASQQKTREVDLTPSAAYRKRLADAFAFVTDTDEPVFTPETMDPVHVGLGCVLTDNVEAVVGILRSWSLAVTVGVVDVAALAGWLPQSRPRSRGLIEQGFSTDDLMVLSHGPGQRQSQHGEVVRDDVLAEYADRLAGKSVLKSSDAKMEREGWELAVSVLGRMDDEAAAQSRIAELLDNIELTDEARVDKILAACLNLELVEQARGIAERYADTLADSTQAYGSALLYYARAHANAKLKDVLALLTSLCFLHSTTIPAQANIDAQLSSLLSKDRTALVQLARTDADAATLLASHLSGYATVRRFYDLRDLRAAGQQGAPRPLERTREAGKALMAVLESASDCIRGGLYDPEIESVVPVDGVLALLGEALPLLGQHKRNFTKEQVFTLLRVVEDFETAPGRIRENAESLLQASIRSYRDGDSGGKMPDVLRKSKSGSDLSKSGSGLGGSSYDMLASSTMFRTQEKTKSGKVLATERSWDWRKGLDAVGGMEAGGQDVLVLLRTALAREVGRGWSGLIHW